MLKNAKNNVQLDFKNTKNSVQLDFQNAMVYIFMA